MRSGISVSPCVSRPSGVFTFSEARPATTSSTPMPSAARRAGSRLTAISRLDDPISFALATPGMLSSRRLIFRSASVVRSRGDMVVDWTASEMIGIALKSNFSMTGSFIPSGSSRRTALIFARASCETSLTFTSRLNSTMTDDSPSREIELTCLTPAIGLTASSIFLVTSRSTVSGDAPGYSVMIDSTGISTSGIMSIGSRRTEKMPSVTSVRIITVATTGRLMDRFERNMATPLRPWTTTTRSPSLQREPAARDHLVAGLDARQDLDRRAVAHARRDGALLRLVAGHHEHLGLPGLEVPVEQRFLAELQHARALADDDAALRRRRRPSARRRRSATSTIDLRRPARRVDGRVDEHHLAGERAARAAVSVENCERLPDADAPRGATTAPTR